MYPKDDMNELEKALYSARFVQKGLSKMNLVCVIAAGAMWVSSLWASVVDALKHGLSWEVIQIVDGVQTVTTRYSIFNILMSGVFLFMMITFALSFSFVIIMRNAQKAGVDQA
jgi:hypothetical protein